MTDSFGLDDVETAYDLLLPDGIGAIVNLHWDEQSPVQRLRNRHVELVSFRLGEYVLTGSTAQVRERRKRLGGGLQKLPLAPKSAECIVLHHALDDPPPMSDLSQRACREELMRICKGIMAPDGVLAIACTNRWSVDRLRGALSAPSMQLPSNFIGSGLSLWGCRRLLHRAAFKVSDAFAVVPSVDNPTAIVSTRREAAQVFYGRAKAQMRDNLPHWAVLPVKLLHALNLRSCLEPTFFVLARHD